MRQALLEHAWLCLTAFLAGGINALAGGGTLLTFPALIGVLRPQFGDAAGVWANCTSTVALVPASLGSAWGFRRELHALRHLLVWLVPPSILGGAIGARLLVVYPERFNNLIPWLILTAAILFSLQPLLVRRRAVVASENGKRPPSGRDGRPPAAGLAGMIALQLLISVYGGYFGAGIGILMLAGFGLMGLSNVHEMNGLKSVLGTAINGVAIVVFIWQGTVHWQYAAMMMATSTAGGYLAAHFGRQVSGRRVRHFVTIVGFLLAAHFFEIPSRLANWLSF